MQSDTLSKKRDVQPGSRFARRCDWRAKHNIPSRKMCNQGPDSPGGMAQVQSETLSKKENDVHPGAESVPVCGVCAVAATAHVTHPFGRCGVARVSRVWVQKESGQGRRTDSQFRRVF